MKIHELKILPSYFEAVKNGEKTFELRKDDRGFKVGDILVLKEFKHRVTDSTGPELVVEEEGGYTGREIRKRISYIYKGGSNWLGLGLRKGFSILALAEANYNAMEKCIACECKITKTDSELNAGFCDECFIKMTMEDV